jgi:hypothetical protein
MSIIVLLSAATLAMTASATTLNHNKQELARGQPEVGKNLGDMVYESYEISSYDMTEVYATTLEATNLEIPGLRERNAVKIETMVIIGERKIRDVDWCSRGGIYIDYRTDKRNALICKTVRLARGLGSTKIC